MQRSHGPNSKQSRNLKKRGRLSVRQRLSSFAQGSAVRLRASPATKNGRPHLRFNSLIGKVVGMQGGSYKVAVRMGGKTKTLVISDEHLETA